MPLFRFHLRTLTGTELDETGLEFPNLEAAYLEACRSIPSMITDFVQAGLNPLAYVFEITDAAGQVLIEVPFTERLRDGQPPSRPKRSRLPRSRTTPCERRSAAKIVYQLRCSYRFTDHRQGLVIGMREVKARDTGAAVVAAQKLCLDPPDMQMASAILVSPEGTLVWTRYGLREPERWANATRGLPRYAQV